MAFDGRVKWGTIIQEQSRVIVEKSSIRSNVITCYVSKEFFVLYLKSSKGIFIHAWPFHGQIRFWTSGYQLFTINGIIPSFLKQSILTHSWAADWSVESYYFFQQKFDEFERDQKRNCSRTKNVRFVLNQQLDSISVFQAVMHVKDWFIISRN